MSGGDVKQVIVIRRFNPGLRRGKEIAQGAHAAMEWLAARLEKRGTTAYAVATLSIAEQRWLNSGYVKVVCYVRSEEELRELQEKAAAAGVQAHLITDAGLTEFGGTPTVTALGVGPDWADKVDEVTGQLPLY